MSAMNLWAAPSQALQTSLSPRLQKAVRLLQMSSQDFAQQVREVLDTNPFLESEDLEEAGAAADSELPQEEPPWGADPLPRARLDDDTAFDSLVAPVSLAEHLLSQLRVLPLGPRDRLLAEAVAQSLDDDGYLRTGLHEVAACVALEPPAEPDELQIALRRVQALEPAGVGARSVAECLELQLEAIGCPRQRGLALQIVRDHLATLASRELRGLAQRLGCTQTEAEAACAAIRRLDPHPGWRWGTPSIQYVTPDVLVRKSRGRWTASINEAVVPRVKLNHAYADMFKRYRTGHDALGATLQEAKWTVRNVEQRFSTILSVAQAILDRQQHFLSYGPMAMRPLALRDIAGEVGVHESTVSRVTNNKFMATPCGVFELKYFFSRAMPTRSGAECSPTAIRSLVGELIAAESPANPLSDVEIARQLAQQGLQVARRTVTKYRQALRIEPAEQRRARVRPA